MEYKNIIEELLVNFPNLRKVYEEEGDYIEGLPHLVYEIVFVRYIVQICNKGDNEEELRKIANFIENMMISSDEDVQNVAVVSVLESISYDEKEAKILIPYLGKRSLEWFKKYAEYLF